MMRVERIRLVLPSSLGHDARGVAIGIAEGLAAGDPQCDGHIARLSIPPVRIDAAAGPSEAAQSAVRAVLDQLRERHASGR